MAPKERKLGHVKDEKTGAKSGKRVTKLEVERSICIKRIEALEQSESFSTDDRFTPQERQQLLEAYNECGFQIFQDTKLLHKYFPNRRESDLIGLVNRLQTGLQSVSECDQQDNLHEWRALSQSLISHYSRDTKINLNEALSDALMLMSEQRLSQNDPGSPREGGDVEGHPNYSELLKSFSQMLSGKFPDNMTPENARVCQNLFQHVNHLVDSLDVASKLSELVDGTSIQTAFIERRNVQEMALNALEEFDRLGKKDITLRDIEQNKELESLCLELPKVKRITEVLNPLHINESLMSSLMNL